jgi:hypothetical protein
MLIPKKDNEVWDERSGRQLRHEVLRSFPFRVRMTATTTAKAKSKGKMLGSLHYATHDEAVSGSGRDDAVFG